jgi:hypothetical protein
VRRRDCLFFFNGKHPAILGLASLDENKSAIRRVRELLMPRSISLVATRYLYRKEFIGEHGDETTDLTQGEPIVMLLRRRRAFFLFSGGCDFGRGRGATIHLYR